MNDAGMGKMPSDKTLHPFPIPAATTSLTATAEHGKPMTSDLVDESTDAIAVARHGVIIQPALHNTSQPAAGFAEGPVLSRSQLRLDRLKSRTHASGHRVPMDREPTILSRLRALVREAKKVKSPGPALAVSFSPFNRKATELDQASLAFMQFQAKLGEPRVEFLQTRDCFAVVLETDHEVVRRPPLRGGARHHHHIAAATVVPPLLDPQLEDIMQEHVRQQR